MKAKEKEYAGSGWGQGWTDEESVHVHWHRMTMSCYGQWGISISEIKWPVEWNIEAFESDQSTLSTLRLSSMSHHTELNWPKDNKIAGQ